MTTATNIPSLSTIVEKRTSELFKKHGVFFAFGDAQFEEQKDKNLQASDYCSVMGIGDCVPVVNAKEFVTEYKDVMKKGREELLTNFTPEQIIAYELANYECYYTGELDDAMRVLEGYEFTLEQVKAVYRSELSKHAE